MKQFLLDTNALLFWTISPRKLTAYAAKIIEDPRNELFFSAISTWEVVIKHGTGKLDLPEPPERYVSSRLATHSIMVLPFEQSDALAIAKLPAHHEDPFDRALIAQAIERDLPVVTADPRFEQYGVSVVW